MASSPRNKTPRTDESCFTCSQRKDSISPPSSRKWSSGQLRMRIPTIKPLSAKFKRISSNFSLQCGDAGPERPSLPPDPLRCCRAWFSPNGRKRVRNRRGWRQRITLPTRRAAQTALAQRNGGDKAEVREVRRVPLHRLPCRDKNLNVMNILCIEPALTREKRRLHKG